jgi:hypothetical protein
MAGGSLADLNYWRCAGSSARLIPPPARTCQPDLIAVDLTVEIATPTVLLEESVEVGEQVSVTLSANTATLLGRSRRVNVSDGGHYFPFGPWSTRLMEQDRTTSGARIDDGDEPGRLGRGLSTSARSRAA